MDFSHFLGLDHAVHWFTKLYIDVFLGPIHSGTEHFGPTHPPTQPASQPASQWGNEFPEFEVVARFDLVLVLVAAAAMQSIHSYGRGSDRSECVDWIESNRMRR